MHLNTENFDLDLSAILPEETHSEMKEEIVLPDNYEVDNNEINLLLSMFKENISTAFPPKEDEYFKIEVDDCEEIFNILKKQPRTTQNYNRNFAKSAPRFFGGLKQIPLAGRVLKCEGLSEVNSTTGTTLESSEVQNVSSNTLFLPRPVPRRVSNGILNGSKSIYS